MDQGQGGEHWGVFSEHWTFCHCRWCDNFFRQGGNEWSHSLSTYLIFCKMTGNLHPTTKKVFQQLLFHANLLPFYNHLSDFCKKIYTGKILLFFPPQKLVFSIILPHHRMTLFGQIALHSCFAFMLCIRAFHSCFSFVPCIHALHLWFTFVICIHALHSWFAFVLLAMS